MREKHKIGGGSGIGSGTSGLYYLKVERGRGIGKPRREEEEQGAAQPVGALTENFDFGYVISGPPSDFFSVLNGMMNERGMLAAFGEEKSRRGVAFYSAMHCVEEMGFKQGIAPEGWRKRCP